LDEERCVLPVLRKGVLKMLELLEDARNASWMNGKAWLMDNRIIALTECQKRHEESKGAKVYATFMWGEQVEE